MAYSEIEICALVERPELHAHRALLDRAWAPWVLGAQSLQPQPGLVETSEAEPRHTLLLWQSGVLVGSLISKRTDLSGFPDQGWDRVQRSAPGARICALAVSIDPAARGQGHSKRLLQAAKAHLGPFIVPVRPTAKPQGVEMADYLKQNNTAGLSVDPWLRTHQRVGGQIQGVSRDAMQLRAPWERWEAWLGEHPGTHPSLVGHLERHGDRGIYREDNVWVSHS